MQPKLLKYILDIESVIKEIELVKERTSNDFNQFSKDIILQRAVERNLEIIGEAVKKMMAINSNINISSSKNIIGLRNIIAHAYDSVDPEMLWAIIQKNVPVLKEEIMELKR
jgi:uncharacterized protein with HEPN domain